MSDVLVLCYHAVSERWDSSISITPGRLEEQLRFLVGKGYRGATFHDAATIPPGPKSLVVTFDDAFLSVYDFAYPILSSLDLPGTLFVPTRKIGNGSPMSWEGIDSWLGTPHERELVGMSWDQVGQLAGAGWEIGSHTQTHRHLTALNDDALQQELRGSREDCEQRIGARCNSLAYPFGNVDERVVRAARAAGYSVAGSIEPVVLYPPAPLNWPRVGIYYTTDWRRFRRNVSPRWRSLRNSWIWPSIDRVRRRLRPRF